GDVRMWDPAAGRSVRNLLGHNDRPLAIAWSPQGSTLACAGGDSTVRLWNAEMGQPPRTLSWEGPYQGGITAFAWSPDGIILAAGEEGWMVRLWHAESGKFLRTCPEHGAPSSASSWIPTALAWSGDSKTLATTSSDNKVHLWDAGSGSLMGTLQG